MPIVAQETLDAASTTFDAAFTEHFSGGPPVQHPGLTKIIPNDSEIYENDVVNAFPRAREWIGAKQFKDLRAQKQVITLTSYEASFKLKRKKLIYNSAGTTAQAIEDWMIQHQWWYDDILFAKLLANAWTGYDAVSLLNDSHPFTNSTGDNLTTSALTQATLDAGVQAMEDFQNEDGKPLGTFPTILLVGPALRKTATDLTGSDRLVPLDAGSAEGGTTVTVGKLPNYVNVGGSVTVVVSPWITGIQWFLIDGSKQAKPMIMVQNRSPENIEQTDMTGEARFVNDEFRWSIEADIAPAAGLWQTIYGSVTAS